MKRGENPYAWNFSDMLRVFRDAGLSFTPFLDGAAQNRVTYPALPILTVLGFNLIGIGQVRIISLVFQILLLVLIFVGTPQRFRTVLVLPLFLLKEFVPFSLGGIQDVVWSALLVGMILAWKHRLLRAVLFGLACAYRQQPWFVAPFLLIDMWHQPGSVRMRWRQIVCFLGISLGTFMAINLPFIVWDPIAWALGAFEPAYARFDVVSAGLGALTQHGLAPFPREFYTVLQISSYLIMLIVYWRHARAIGQAFWIFPGIFFWVYYRGLPNYWIYWIPPLLVAMIRHRANDGELLSFSSRPSTWIATVALTTPLLLANLIGGFALFQLNPPVQVCCALPLEAFAYGRSLVDRIQITVTNSSQDVLLPRFSAQRDGTVQALPWAIESGPEHLAPGESASYIITANQLPAKTFAWSTGGQIVLTDAGGNYWLRAVLTIPSAPSPTQSVDTRTLVSDAIAHPDIYYTNLGDGYRRQRDFELANAAYLHALTYAQHPNIYFGLGWTHYYLGDYDAARDYFEKSLRLNPNFAEAHLGLGWTHVRRDDCAAAVLEFQRALELDARLTDANAGIQSCQP
ncbi:MAG: tetratricopeptide repeat protein [Chloroflexota bacterium]|nr:tetratricopeptide repeat protein [Chloroflexota bacterium]